MGDYTDLFTYLDDYADEIYYEGPVPKKSPNSFHPFSRLPYDLRAHIWRLYCPVLATQPQILQFDFLSHALGALRGQSLARQTATARRVLSAHRESRALALRALPDTLSFQPRAGIVRFRRERDIVLLHELLVADRTSTHGITRQDLGWWPARLPLGPRLRYEGDGEVLAQMIGGLAVGDWGPEWRPLPGFSENVVNLAVVVRHLEALRRDLACPFEFSARFFLAFPNLRFVWSCLDHPSTNAIPKGFKNIGNKEADAIVYAPQLVEEVLNPLGPAASSVFPGDPSPWREYLAEASILKLLVHRGRRMVGALNWGVFTTGEIERLRGISVWPLVASQLERRQKERRRIEEERRLSALAKES